MKDIGNIKSEKGKMYKVLWDKETYEVEFSDNADGPFYKAPTARSEAEAKANAKEEADRIEA